jgi:hypothetical protein
MNDKRLKAERAVCKKCKFKYSCSDLPAFCAFAYFVPPTLVIGMLVYFYIYGEL